MLLELIDLTEQLLLADLACFAHLLLFILQQVFEFVNDLLKITSLASLLLFLYVFKIVKLPLKHCRQRRQPLLEICLHQGFLSSKFRFEVGNSLLVVLHHLLHLFLQLLYLIAGVGFQSLDLVI